MTYPNPTALVDTDWLAAHMTAPDVRIVDGTWYMHGADPTARADFEAEHIPAAVFFDIDAIARQDTDLPHMLPEPERFAARVRKLGLGDGNRIIIYDRFGLMSAARVWWMFRVFGHDDVAVLNGGLPKWKAEGRPVTDDSRPPQEKHFTARLNNPLVRSIDQVARNIDSRREQLIDARSAGRFAGTDPEIWPGRRGGHIPGSLNLPFNSLIDPDNKTVLAADRLAAAVDAAGIDLKKPVTATCGSGVTACVLALALHLLGKDDVAVYDGSWAEWGLPGDRPVATGPAGA